MTLLCGTAHAQDTAVMTLRDCIRYALSHSAEMRVLQADLGDAQLAEGQVYTLVTAPEITGTFHEMKVPGRWRVSVHPTKVTLAYANGTVLMLR